MVSTGHKSYTASYKLTVVESAEKMGNRAAARKHSVNERCVRRWRSEKSELEKMPKFKKAQRSGIVAWPHLEEKLESWVRKREAKSLPLTLTNIRNQAKLMAKKMSLIDFQGGHNWCYRFMKRKNVSVSTKPAQKNKLDLQHCRKNTPVFQSSVFKSYTAGFKLAVVEKAEKVGNRAASREFDVNERCVRRWRSDKEDLERMPKFKRAQRRRSISWPKLEEDLAAWVLKKQDKELPLSVIDICAQALLIAKRMGITNFTGCPKWCNRFLKRKNISIDPNSTTNKTDVYEKQLLVQSTINYLLQELKITKAEIINMFVLSYEFACEPDNDGSESDNRDETLFCTFMLACSANGDKLKPFIVFKENTIYKRSYTSDVIICSNEDGWKCDEIKREWLNKVWRKRKGAIFDPCGILVVDSVLERALESVKSDCDTVLATVVAVPQEFLPMNLIVEKYFKPEMQNHWEEWRNGSERITPEVITSWATESWESISVSTIISSFTEVKLIKLTINSEGKDNFKEIKCEEDEEILRILNYDSNESDFDGFS